MILNNLFKRVFKFYSYIFDALNANYLTKWLVCKLTGKSEIERICFSKYLKNGCKIYHIEKCLNETTQLKCLVDSSDEQLMSGYDNVDTIHRILNKTNIKSSQQPRLIQIISKSLVRINNYKKLNEFIESQRKVVFSFDNDEHVHMLKQLWHSLKPDEDLKNLISKQWVDIGFQNHNPSTDFRGMGLLSLMNLTYFTTNDTFADHSKEIYSKSLHPLYGYSFAIVGINITSWIHKWLSEGNLKMHFFDNDIYNDKKQFLNYFNYVYSIIFIEFNRFWFMNEVESINFEQYTKIFRKIVLGKLNSIDLNFLGEDLRVDLNNT